MTVVGTVGVLLRAKTLGQIPAVKPLLDELSTRHGFRLRPSLIEDVLRAAGELP